MNALVQTTQTLQKLKWRGKGLQKKDLVRGEARIFLTFLLKPLIRLRPDLSFQACHDGSDGAKALRAARLLDSGYALITQS